MSISNVLFVCQDNAVASILAEAYVARAGRGVWRAFSAGIEPSREFNPHVVELLRDHGLRTQRFAPRSLASFTIKGAPRLDLVVAIDLASAPVGVPGLPPVEVWRDAPSVRSGRDAREALAWVRRKADRLILDVVGPVRRFA
jgi:arsenate reductase